KRPRRLRRRARLRARADDRLLLHRRWRFRTCADRQLPGPVAAAAARHADQARASQAHALICCAPMRCLVVLVMSLTACGDDAVRRIIDAPPSSIGSRDGALPPPVSVTVTFGGAPQQ